MKFVASAILIAFVAAQEEEVERVPLIDASTKDTVNDCLFIERTNQGAIRPEDGGSCFGMYFNLCEELYLQPTTSCQIMTYANSQLSWISSSINVVYWPYRNQILRREEYNAEQKQRKTADSARAAAQAIAKSRNPVPTLEPVEDVKFCEEGQDPEQDECVFEEDFLAQQEAENEGFDEEEQDEEDEEDEEESSGATDADPSDPYAPLAPLEEGKVACGPTANPLDDCVRDEGKICLPRNRDPKTRELGAPKSYKRETTLVASAGGITCAYKWQIQNRSKTGSSKITFYRDGAAALAVSSSVAIAAAFLF